MINVIVILTSGTPVHELNGALGLNVGNGCLDILGDDIATVQQAAGHYMDMHE